MGKKWNVLQVVWKTIKQHYNITVLFLFSHI